LFIICDYLGASRRGFTQLLIKKDKVKIFNTRLNGVFRLELNPFTDHRGEYVEIYNTNYYKLAFPKIGDKFIQDDISISRKNVIRGIHGDNKTWKLVSCIYGEMYFVAINCDKKSKNFGEWESFILSDKKRFQLLLSPLYGNAFLVLSDKSIFHYKQTTYYGEVEQFTYKYDDPYFDIFWPIHKNNAILSERDKNVKSIRNEERMI